MTVTLSKEEAVTAISLIDFFIAVGVDAPEYPGQIAFLQNMKTSIHNQLTEEKTLAD